MNPGIAKREEISPPGFPGSPILSCEKSCFRQIRNRLQLKLRVMQNEWWTNLSVRTQWCADAGDLRGFYEALKVVYGPTYQIQSPLQRADRQTLLKDKISSCAVGQKIFKPCLILIKLSKTQHYSTSFSCQSRSKWTNRPQRKNLPKP